MTSKQKIIDILFRDGAIDNYFCIDNRITTRLGAYINDLKNAGWEFTGDYIEGTKNYKYSVVKYPSENSEPKIIKSKTMEAVPTNNRKEISQLPMFHLRSYD